MISHAVVVLIAPHRYTGDKYYYKENSSRSERGNLLPMNYKKIFGSKQIVGLFFFVQGGAMWLTDSGLCLDCIVDADAQS